MKAMKMYSVTTLTAALMFSYSTVCSADTPKLAAPVYKGAVPAMPADGIKVDTYYVGNFGNMKTLDCQATMESRDIAGKKISVKEAEKAGDSAGPWCFLSRDPIDKVKAFYDKAIGPMRAIQGTMQQNSSVKVPGYQVFAERAWFPGGDESGPGYGYSAVSLHALPPPGEPGKEAKNTDDSWEGQEAYKFYAGTRFSCFIDAVDWFGEPGKHKQSELKSYYEKHKQVESALFQRKGPKLESVDAALGAKYLGKREQGEQQARGMLPGQGQGQMSQAQMMQMAQMAQMGQMPPPPAANTRGTPEDAEFNAFMKKNPKVANRYVELTKQLNTLMQQGKFDEADAVDEKLQNLIDANPELAAIEQRAAERAAKASAAGQAQEDQAMGNYQKGMDQAIWGTCQEYIDALEKEAYYTLIVIDNALKGYQKDYTRDQAVIAKDADIQGWVSHQQVWGFSYAANQGGQAVKPADSEPKVEARPKAKPDAKDQVEDTVKKGLKSLKNLF